MKCQYKVTGNTDLSVRGIYHSIPIGTVVALYYVATEPSAEFAVFKAADNTGMPQSIKWKDVEPMSLLQEEGKVLLAQAMEDVHRAVSKAEGIANDNDLSINLKLGDLDAYYNVASGWQAL